MFTRLRSGLCILCSARHQVRRFRFAGFRRLRFPWQWPSGKYSLLFSQRSTSTRQPVYVQRIARRRKALVQSFKVCACDG